MQADLPFYEGPEDALRAAMQALGGAKVVGPMIWPDKTVIVAAQRLLDCTNAARNEKLEISQIMLILRKARDAGFHAPFYWFCGELGYDAKPITKADEVDRLAVVVEQSSKTLSAAVAALERIQRGK